MSTGWIYDHLKPHAAALKVAPPLMLRAIAAAKKKKDRIDVEDPFEVEPRSDHISPSQRRTAPEVRLWEVHRFTRSATIDAHPLCA